MRIKPSYVTFVLLLHLVYISSHKHVTQDWAIKMMETITKIVKTRSKLTLAKNL